MSEPSTKTFPSVCPIAKDGKHDWESVVIGGKWVMPLIWGETRRIQCRHCKKKRELKGDVWEA